MGQGLPMRVLEYHKPAKTSPNESRSGMRVLEGLGGIGSQRERSGPKCAHEGLGMHALAAN